MKTVLFDFDCTLTNRDTLRPLAHHFAKEDRNYFGLALLYFVLVLFRAGVVGDKKLKECFLNIFIKGKNYSKASSAVKDFFDLKLEQLLNRPVFEALEHYKKNSAKIYIVSANFDFLLEPLVQRWGIAGIICTQTEKLNSVFTGNIVGQTCKGKEKVRRLMETFDPREFAGMTAFGDEGDREMLDLVGEAKLIDGD
jgi:HAD superfamily hydrolase (TIGR01490 family)